MIPIPYNDFGAILEKIGSENNKKLSNLVRVADLNIKEDFIGQDLSKIDISNDDLRGINLTSANLSGANLSESDLSGAILKDANLTGANLSGANLSESDLSGAILKDANLTGANLSGANLSESDLLGAILKDANLTGANLSGANLSESDLLGAILKDANPTNTILEKELIQTNINSAMFYQITNNRTTNFDVIFIHGLFGRGRSAWQNSTNNFDWLTTLEQKSNSTIWVVDYDFQRIQWRQENPLRYFSTTLLNIMVDKEIGQHPIIFVGYDLGGLIIKQLMLCLQSLNNTSQWIEIKDNSMGFIFISVPHSSTNIDRWFHRCFASKVDPEPSVEPRLKNLCLSINSFWENSEYIQNDSFKHYYFTPDRQSPQSLVGDEVEGLNEASTLFIPAPHELINQPNDADNILYRKILGILRKCFTQIINISPNGDLCFKVSFNKQIKEIFLSSKPPTRITDIDLNGLMNNLDEVRLWKEIHQLADDIKNQLRAYLYIYTFHQNRQTLSLSENNHINIITQDIQNICVEFLPDNIETIKEMYLRIINNDNNFVNTSLYQYATFFLNITDILLTISQCLGGDHQKDVHVANIIQKWLDKSLRQANQMVKRYIEQTAIGTNRRTSRRNN